MLYPYTELLTWSRTATYKIEARRGVGTPLGGEPMNYRILSSSWVFAALLSAITMPAHAATFVVDSTLDSTDAAPGNGVCDDGGGQCTLRAAIQEANSLAGADSIHFSIGGGGVQTIQPLPLPTISTTVVIDGTTQPGFSGSPLVVLDGSLAGPGAHGLLVGAPGGGCTIRGLVIHSFRNAIFLQGSGSNLVAGNFLGTDVTGTIPLGNTLRGVEIHDGNNTIGGTSAADANVIAASAAEGILVSPSSPGGNVIQGNKIGTDVTGTLALPNGGGVNLRAPNSTVGGIVAGAGNVISGNSNQAIVAQSFATGTIIAGNLIGTQADGTSPLGNGAGIWVRGLGAAASVRIGGVLPGEGNVIAFNNAGGVVVSDLPANEQVSIIGNSIHSNTSLGIDLDGDGVTANDVGDVDTGANGRQNFPVLSSAFGTNTTVEVSGSFEGQPSTTYHLELFASPSCDPSGHGEGQVLIASLDDATDPAGVLGFSVSALGSQPAGSFITATATDPNGSTSEFSACLEVSGCAATPAGGCIAGFAKAQLSISEKTAGKESLKLKWLKGPAFAGEDLGNPLAAGGTTYFLCVYDDSGALMHQYTVGRAGDTCGTKPCWKNLGGAPGDPTHKGYKYKDSLVASDGIAGLGITAGGPGMTRASAKGKNNVAKGQTSLPTGVAAALAGSTSAEIQLLGSDASQCISASLGNVTIADGVQFKAKTP